MSGVTILLAAIGLLSFLSFSSHLLSLFWLYFKPSGLRRYLHETDGKAAWGLVTGASGGIGKNLAQELATRGFNVVLHGRSAERLEELRRELSQAHPNRDFRILVVDAAQCFLTADDVSPMAWASQLDDLNLTVVINNAGGSTERRFDTLEGLSSERLITDMSVNALFPTLLLNQLIPIIHRNAPGLIINIGSLADMGVTKTGSYAPSKAYLMKLTETLGREMRLTQRDIEVLGVRVGSVWGTGQTIAEAPDFFTPDATTVAKAVFARVGCGKLTVVGHWRHMVQHESAMLLPESMRENILVHATGEWKTTNGEKKD